MKLKCASLLISIVFFCHYKSPAAEGCVINSQVYQIRAASTLDLSVLGSNKIFSDYGVPISPCISNTASGSCSVCLTGGTVISINIAGLPVIVCSKGGLLGNYQPSSGTYYASYIVECSLDQYALSFGFFISVIGFVAIKKRTKRTDTIPC